MKTISQAVSEYVKSKPFLSSALSDGIINFTSLSRKIKPDIEEILRKKVNNGAIVMALNRLSINLEFQHTQKIKRVIKKIQEISVRSNLVDYNFKVSNTILIFNSLNYSFNVLNLMKYSSIFHLYYINIIYKEFYI